MEFFQHRGLPNQSYIFRAGLVQSTVTMSVGKWSAAAGLFAPNLMASLRRCHGPSALEVFLAKVLYLIMHASRRSWRSRIFSRDRECAMAQATASVWPRGTVYFPEGHRQMELMPRPPVSSASESCPTYAAGMVNQGCKGGC